MIDADLYVAAWGYRFMNSFRFGRLHFGLCGGMALTSLRAYKKEQLLQAKRPDKKQTLWLIVWQLWSLAKNLALWQVLVGTFMEDGYLQGTTVWEVERLTRMLRAYGPQRVLLIGGSGWRTLTKSHQVVAINYTKRPDGSVDIVLYNPNCVGAPTRLDGNTLIETTGHKWRGLMVA